MSNLLATLARALDEAGIPWTPYEQEALRRARVFKIQGYPVRYASPEDVVIHKVLAGRPRDLEDVKNILRKQQLDLAYVRKWLDAFEQSLSQPFRKTFEEIVAEIAEAS